MTKWYLTKYVLSSNGLIQTLEAERRGDYVYRGTHAQYRIGKDAFDNLSDALKDAEKRRNNSVSVLMKRTKILMGMKFHA